MIAGVTHRSYSVAGSCSFQLKAQMKCPTLKWRTKETSPLITLPPSLAPAGWGEMPNVHTKSEASWGEPSSPSAAVDNGTSAWGKPPSSGTGWGESPAEPAGTYGRTAAPTAAPALCKPGTCVGITARGLERWRRFASGRAPHLPVCLNQSFSVWFSKLL